MTLVSRGTATTVARRMFESPQQPAGFCAAAIGTRDPSECLKDLLELPVRVENVSLKRPSLNDVFLQLAGRNLRE